MKRGHSREIDTALLRQIVLKYIAAADGIDVVVLLAEADVHFVDAVDKDVALDSVAVTWGDG